MPGHSMAKLLEPPLRKFSWVVGDRLGWLSGIVGEPIFWGFVDGVTVPHKVRLTSAEVRELTSGNPWKVLAPGTEFCP